MSEQYPIIGKYYKLTPKAMRHMMALKVYEQKMDELSKLSDDEIVTQFFGVNNGVDLTNSCNKKERGKP